MGSALIHCGHAIAASESFLQMHEGDEVVMNINKKSNSKAGRLIVEIIEKKERQEKEKTREEENQRIRRGARTSSHVENPEMSDLLSPRHNKADKPDPEVQLVDALQFF